MKEAHVSKDTTITLHDVPIPEPTSPFTMLISVHVAGTNPKDWKMPAGILTTISDCPNSGDDIAGTVHSVHATVKDFKPGDRIAALHELGKPHGAFAEYALVHSFACFRIPETMSFEEAATLPMAIFMAGIGLFAQLRVASGPWLPLKDPRNEADAWKEGYSGKPVLIYGASGTVGAMAVKLAQLANVHPLICVAGGGVDYVGTLINRDKGDCVIDYRRGEEILRKELQAAIPEGRSLQAAFDVVTEHGSWLHICSVLDPTAGRLTITLPPAKEEVPKTVEQTATMAASLWRGLQSISGKNIGDLGFAEGQGRIWSSVYSKGIEEMLAEGKLKPQDHEVVSGGLGKGLEEALQKLRFGKGRDATVKRVVRVADTEGLKQ